MKKLSPITAIVIGLLLLAAVAQTSCSSKGGSISKLIGEDAQMVVLVPNLGKTVADLGGMFDWLASKNPMLGMMKGQLQMQMGFDVTKAEELAKRGFDPEGGAAFVMTDVQKEDGYALLAVKDQKAFIAFLNEMQKKEAKPEYKKDGDFYSNGSESLITFKKGFAVVGGNKELLKKVGSGDSMDESDSYKLASKNVGDAHDFFIYMSPEFFKAAAKQATGAAEEQKALSDLSKLYGGIGVGLDVNKSEIAAKAFIHVKDMEKVKKIYASASPSEMMAKMPSGAAVLARFRLDMGEAWSYMKNLVASTDANAKQEMEAALEQLKQMAGFDVEKELIGNIAGSPVVAFYGMTGRAGATPDVVISFKVKEEGAIKGSLEKLAAMLSMGQKPKKSKLANLGVIEISPEPGMTVYLAVTQGNLIVAMTPDRMQAAMASLAGTSGGNALSSVPHAEAKAMLEDKSKDVIYVNVGQLVTNVKKGMSREEAQMMDMYLAQMGGVQGIFLLAHSEMAEQGFSGGLKIHLGQ